MLWNGIGLAYETKNKASMLIRRRAYHLFRKTNDQTQISRINNHTHDSGHAQTKDTLLVRSILAQTLQRVKFDMTTP